MTSNNLDPVSHGNCLAFDHLSKSNIKNIKKTKGYLDLPIILSQFISPKSNWSTAQNLVDCSENPCRVDFRVLASIAKVDRCLPNPRHSQWCNSDLVGFSQFGEGCWSPPSHHDGVLRLVKNGGLGHWDTRVRSCALLSINLRLVGCGWCFVVVVVAVVVDDDDDDDSTNHWFMLKKNGWWCWKHRDLKNSPTQNCTVTIWLQKLRCDFCFTFPPSKQHEIQGILGRTFPYLHPTVDGRNPAPPGMYKNTKPCK